MSPAYEARVAVRGELASPKSFPRLIRNNKDGRDKRETHPRTLTTLHAKTECIFPAEDETLNCLVHCHVKKNTPFNFSVFL